MGPLDLLPYESKGFPEHPHRGFVTVTYMLEGRFEHKDSQGNSGSFWTWRCSVDDRRIWLGSFGNARKEFAKSGGRLHGSQSMDKSSQN